METADYLNKIRQDVQFNETLRGHTLSFHTTWGLFSPKSIDEGTHLLLKHIDVGERDDCLDLGCGYGPVGLTLARMAPRGRTLMVDKDFIAVEYANKNARINHIENAQAMLSNAFAQVGERSFDLIASNVPAKVGKEMLTLIMHDAHAHLRPGGHFYVVTITGLRRVFERGFKEVFGNYKKVKQGANYTVAMAVRE